MLPGLSGYRVTQRLRAEGSQVPVLMLSAKDGEYDQADGLDLGADDYLTKPFAWVVFVAHLKALLRRARGRAGDGPESAAQAHGGAAGGPAGTAVSGGPVGGGQARGVSGEVVVGDLVLDPAAHTVERGGVPVDLTAREFALLEHLMRARGRVVAKTELLATVWGGMVTDDPNVVEVYAGYLRRKIDQPFGRRSLLTVRGAGYRLVPDDDRAGTRR
jgi:DNA-binding response OmpR family regulator